MMPLLLIFSVAIVSLHDQIGRGEFAVSYQPGYAMSWLWGLSGLIWLTSHAFTLIAARQLDRSGNFRWSIRTDVVLGGSRLAGLIVLGFAVYQYGLLDDIRRGFGQGFVFDQTLALLPYWLLLVAGWISRYEIDRRLHDALFYRAISSGLSIEPLASRLGFTWLQTRHQLLMWVVPLCLMNWLSRWAELVLGNHPTIADRLGSGTAFVQLLITLSVIALSPILILRIWRTLPLAAGELRERILAVCAAHRIHVRGPYVWRTGTGMLNAAVLGPVYPLRYLIYTDALLESLSPRQLDAVTAHEVAHLRYWHIAWLGVVTLATLNALSVALPLGAWFVLDRRWAMMNGWHDEALGVAAWIGALAVFFYVSRRFEWQADAFAVRHLSLHPTNADVVTEEAAAAMAGALRVIASANGMRENAFMWRHGSIADRRRRVMDLVGRNVREFPIDHTVRRIRWASVLLICVSLIVQSQM
jgi:STE24 endopeptidase